MLSIDVKQQQTDKKSEILLSVSVDKKGETDTLAGMILQTFFSCNYC